MTEHTTNISAALSPEPSPSIDFECTQCGTCCHGLRLPLTITEAIAWLARGGNVELLCEAIPWQSEPEPDQLVAAHKRRRSFPAASGALPVRVIVVLAARFEDACPNLQDDQRCGIYHERPLVCRIYPAEINPFIALQPAHKVCPPEAWMKPLPMLREGRIVDAQIWADVSKSRASDEREAPLKARLCTMLGIDIAEFSTIGFAVHHPDQQALLEALRTVAATPSAEIVAAAAPVAAHVGGNTVNAAVTGARDVTDVTDVSDAAGETVALPAASTAGLPAWRFSTTRDDLLEALVSIGATVAGEHTASAGGARWERLSLT
jgi:Fe-S-cluster containining protein